MLALSGDPRIFVYQESMDLRKGFEGLGAIVQSTFCVELTSGAYFAFLNRRRDRMKVLYWDGDGLVIWYKRLEKGQFSKKKSDNPVMNRREFLMLLEGITPKRLQVRYNIS
jgi:transposase